MLLIQVKGIWISISGEYFEHSWEFFEFEEEDPLFELEDDPLFEFEDDPLFEFEDDPPKFTLWQWMPVPNNRNTRNDCISYNILQNIHLEYNVQK